MHKSCILLGMPFLWLHAKSRIPFGVRLFLMRNGNVDLQCFAWQAAHDRFVCFTAFGRPYFLEREISMSYLESAAPVKSRAAASGLKTSRLTFCEAAMMIVGSTIGSGVLGLAYASRRAGWPVLVIWLAVAALISAVSMLYVAEASLRTRLPLQLSGLAERYIGKVGSWLLFFAVGATSFCSLIAYTNGCGKILSDLLGISFEAGSLLFILPAVGVIWFGLKATGVAEKFISSGMIAMLLVLGGASFLSSRVPMGDILYTDWTYAMPIFNITVFCYAVQYMVPEVARGFSHQPGKLVPSILAGFAISFVILAVVPLSVFLMLPLSEITEVASLSWGRALSHPIFYLLVNVFAFCAMLTSFWVISESFLTNMVDQFKLKNEFHVPTRITMLAFIVLPPFLLAFFGAVSFVNAIFFAGTFGGIIMSILPVFMLQGARRSGDMDPVWTCGWIAARPIQILLIVVFSAAGLYALASMAGMLPSGW